MQARGHRFEPGTLHSTGRSSRSPVGGSIRTTAGQGARDPGREEERPGERHAARVDAHLSLLDLHARSQDAGHQGGGRSVGGAGRVRPPRSADSRLSLLNRGNIMIPKNRVPTHPGEVLFDEFLDPLGITQVHLAAHIGVPVQRVNEIARGKRPPVGLWRPATRGDKALEMVFETDPTEVAFIKSLFAGTETWHPSL